MELDRMKSNWAEMDPHPVPTVLVKRGAWAPGREAL